VMRAAELADVPVLFEPAHLPVVGNVAPDQVLALATPGRPFRPLGAGPDALDLCVADFVLGEALIEDDDVGIGIPRGILAAPITLGASGRRKRGARGRGGQEGSSVQVRFHRASRERISYQVQRANEDGALTAMQAKHLGSSRGDYDVDLCSA